MFFLNPLSLLIELELSKYLFGAFAFYSAFLLVRLLILNKGVNTK